MNRQTLAKLVYVIAAVVTYGHAYHNQNQYVVMFSGEKREADALDKGFVGILASGAWPLYWSQHFWSKK
jgi:hypothetical protein